MKNTDLYVPRYYSPVISTLLGPSIFLSNLFPKTISLGDQVSHQQKTTGKIIFLYILIFIFLDSKLEEKRFCSEQFPDFRLLQILSWIEFWFVRVLHKCTKSSTLSKHLLSRKSLCYYVMYLYIICETLYVVQQSQTWPWC